MTDQRDTDWTAGKLRFGYEQERMLLLSAASCPDSSVSAISLGVNRLGLEADE